MKGLEVSIIPFHEVNLGDRADAEYFSKENRAIERALREHDAVALREFGTLVGSAFYPAATELYEEGDVPFARCVDCIEHLVITRLQDSEFVRIPSWFVEQSKQIDCATRGDIIITKVGTPCFASIVRDYERIALSRTVLGLVRIHDINPYYLTAFLRCRFGFNQLSRQREQTIQFQLTLDRVREVLVYRASPKLQSAVERTMVAHIAALEEAYTKLSQAEATLTEALGLGDWHPPDPLTYTRRASEVFAARRVDSPYFSPRVSELLQLLGRDNLQIRDVAPARHEEFIASSSGEFDYIEISDIQTDGTVSSNRVAQSEAPSRATWHVRSGDVLASTVRPIRRLSAIIAPEQDSFVCSSGFVVLTPQSVSPELLLTYLRLPQVCELMDLHTSASMYPAISEKDLLNLPFRCVPSDVERKIVSAVQQSHSARREAHILLDRAKRAVEIAIEQSEAEALRYLSESSA
ncbi:MAG: hypothetical protein KF722_09690 [Nitrospira sp.]|nr:hypothetical protein [Nitrospira sp.]